MQRAKNPAEASVRGTQGLGGRGVQALASRKRSLQLLVTAAATGCVSGRRTGSDSRVKDHLGAAGAGAGEDQVSSGPRTGGESGTRVWAGTVQVGGRLKLEQSKRIRCGERGKAEA